MKRVATGYGAAEGTTPCTAGTEATAPWMVEPGTTRFTAGRVLLARWCAHRARIPHPVAGARGRLPRARRRRGHVAPAGGAGRTNERGYIAWAWVEHPPLGSGSALSGLLLAALLAPASAGMASGARGWPGAARGFRAAHRESVPDGGESSRTMTPLVGGRIPVQERAPLPVSPGAAGVRAASGSPPRPRSEGGRRRRPRR